MDEKSYRFGVDSKIQGLESIDEEGTAEDTAMILIEDDATNLANSYGCVSPRTFRFLDDAKVRKV